MRLARRLVPLFAFAAAAPLACERQTRRPVDQPDAAVADLAAPPDLALALPDLAGPGPDLAEPPDLAPAIRLLGCATIVGCNVRCGADPVCQARCPPLGTAMAQGLYADLIRCIVGDPQEPMKGACPAFAGGICDVNAPGFDPVACTDCQDECQAEGGPCFFALVECSLHCVIDDECRFDPEARCIDNTCEVP